MGRLVSGNGFSFETDFQPKVETTEMFEKKIRTDEREKVVEAAKSITEELLSNGLLKDTFLQRLEQIKEQTNERSSTNDL